MTNLFEQFIKFAGVGVIGTAAHYAVLVVLIEVLGADAVVASSTGALVGALVNYILNYRYTFQSTKRHSEALTKFLVIAGVGFVLNGIMMAVMTKILSIHYFLAQVVSTSSVLVWNFAGNRIWTFSHRTS